MKILITNDDGIEAEGLRLLVGWAKKLGEVTVFAPKIQQSAKSHSIEIHKPYEVRRVEKFDGVETWSVDSTPADCVRIAILGMKKQFDLVLSGINCGPNLGGDIHYSGTVGACFEAAMSGVRSLALSAAFNSFENAMRNLDRVYDEIMRRKLFDYAGIVNVNFPDVGDEILFTRTGPAVYTDEFDFDDEGFVVPRLKCLYTGTRDLTLDTDATMTGHISVTPLHYDLTNFSALNTVK